MINDNTDCNIIRRTSIRHVSKAGALARTGPGASISERTGCASHVSHVSRD